MALKEVIVERGADQPLTACTINGLPPGDEWARGSHPNRHGLVLHTVGTLTGILTGILTSILPRPELSGVLRLPAWRLCWTVHSLGRGPKPWRTPVLLSAHVKDP